jgi:hypothetical protein
MKKTVHILFFMLFYITLSYAVFAQEKITSKDAELKETLYKKYKREVQSYDKNDFDKLFFEFFKKQKDESITLTKEEIYTYTIKIALYSEKRGLLYKDQKAEADKTKQEWYDRSYSDYLMSKK